MKKLVRQCPFTGWRHFYPWAFGTLCLCRFAVCDFPKVCPKGKIWLFCLQTLIIYSMLSL
ncbi:hypothetical protein D7V86_24205 [bacterium D16-51]|nr:hypothetical protein D7V96_23530 [bacterium D16-59]RKI54065.1 hypothetical protein D7V86_24205 [bacterium D16-51]